MSLIGAVNLGGSALSATQAALQITGNNIANAGNADYTRQVANLAEAPEQQLTPTTSVGTGVDVASITRQADEALNSRLNTATSDNSAASTTQQALTQVESVYNASGTDNLQTTLDSFYQGWSTLANNPQDTAQRSIVIQQGEQVAQQFNTMSQQITSLQVTNNTQLANDAQQANALASQIASLNGQIVVAQAGSSGGANALLDQRDAALNKLSQLVNINTAAQPNGSVNVYIGSQQLVSGTQSSGLAVQNTEVNGQPTTQVVFTNGAGTAPVTSGAIGGLMASQTQIASSLGQLNTLSSNLIFQLNELHSQGQGLEGYTSVTATNAVTDDTAALGSAASGLKFSPTNGSFVVHVKDTSTGLETSTLVQVNPNTTTLSTLETSLNAVNGVSASIVGGKLQINTTASGTQLTFSQDSSGTLAALGINTFFSGTNAGNMAVNSTVSNDPSLIAAAQNGQPDDNTNALAIANLNTQPVAALNGASLSDTYQSMINDIAVQTNNAQTNATAAQNVQTTLQNQKTAQSGVSIDQEAINLIQQQTAYQGAARFISTVNNMMQSLLNISIT
jgi:flagellar hook-associated protein 1 FlgK